MYEMSSIIPRPSCVVYWTWARNSSSKISLPWKKKSCMQPCYSPFCMLPIQCYSTSCYFHRKDDKKTHEEAERLAELKHPNIVQYFDSGFARRPDWPDWKDWLKRRRLVYSYNYFKISQEHCLWNSNILTSTIFDTLNFCSSALL